MSEHTPTPYHVHESVNGFAIAADPKNVAGRSNAMVASAWPYAYSGASKNEQAKADMEFLVKAANSYASLKEENDRMREALDAAESILRYVQDFSTNCNGTKPNMTTRKAHALVVAALSKARG